MHPSYSQSWIPLMEQERFLFSPRHVLFLSHLIPSFSYLPLIKGWFSLPRHLKYCSKPTSKEVAKSHVLNIWQLVTLPEHGGADKKILVSPEPTPEAETALSTSSFSSVPFYMHLSLRNQDDSLARLQSSLANFSFPQKEHLRLSSKGLDTFSTRSRRGAWLGLQPCAQIQREHQHGSPPGSLCSPTALAGGACARVAAACATAIAPAQERKRPLPSHPHNL